MKQKNKSKCPFCGGTKVKPFTGSHSQNCNECDKNGLISNKKLREMGLDEFIFVPKATHQMSVDVDKS